MSKKPLPPILEQMIEQLQNTKQDRFKRDNYCLMLENIVEECTNAIDLYKASLKRIKVVK